jgi:threonylcarbamoyladenosine tRNA methylthiotransferase MtaB
MFRPITPATYSKVVEGARDRVPDISITTDIIAGFPGETEDEFEENLEFIQIMKFADAHIFTYSPRSGTPAMRIPNHVSSQIARDRSRNIQEVIDKSAIRYAKRFVGTQLTVLWESTTALDGNGWEVVGLTDNYLRVKSILTSNLLNTLSVVRITEVNEDVILGEVVDSL